MTIRDALKECEDQVNRLEVENQDLRRSALEFGELAERLNRALRQRLRSRMADADAVEGRGNS